MRSAKSGWRFCRKQVFPQLTAHFLLSSFLPISTFSRASGPRLVPPAVTRCRRSLVLSVRQIRIASFQSSDEPNGFSVGPLAVPIPVENGVNLDVVWGCWGQGVKGWSLWPGERALVSFLGNYRCLILRTVPQYAADQRRGCYVLSSSANRLEGVLQR